MRRIFLQIPGPSNIPETVLKAMANPPIDHRSQEFSLMLAEIKYGLMDLFQATNYEVGIFPGSGTGGMEAAIVNTLSPGAKVLCFNQGVFSERFGFVAQDFGLDVRFVEIGWGQAISESLLYQELNTPFGRSLDALLVTHTETSTGVTNNLAMVRRLLDEVESKALLLVDAVSSLGITPIHSEEYGCDAVVAASQKGLMMPAGLTMVAFSRKAMNASINAGLPKSYWNINNMVARNSVGLMPYTPAINLLYALHESLSMIAEETLPEMFHRHKLNAAAIRAALSSMHLELLCVDANAHSNAVTCVRLPLGYDEAVLQEALAHYGLIVGGGLGRYQGKLLRISHMGSLYESDVFAIVSILETVLYDLGMPLRLGDAVTASQETYAKAYRT